MLESFSAARRSAGTQGGRRSILKRTPAPLSFNNLRQVGFSRWRRDLPTCLPGLQRRQVALHTLYPSARAFASASTSLLSPSSVAFTRAFTAGNSAAPATFSLANR